MHRVTVVLLVLAACLPQCGGQSPNAPGGLIELPDTRQGQLVAIRLTHIDEQQLGFSGPVKIHASSTFEGEVVGLPLAASVWLAVRWPALEAKWQILFPPAITDESGHWRNRIEVPCPADNGRSRCEVMAIVSKQVVEKGEYDEAWIRKNVYKRTEPIEVQVLPRVEGQEANASLKLLGVAEMPADSAQPVLTPSTFSVDGSSENLRPGAMVWAFANCLPSRTWVPLGHSTTGSDGKWRLNQLTLPPLQEGGRRGCSLQVLAGPEVPPPQPTLERELLKWASARSARVQLIRNPYYMSISAVTDITGRPLSSHPTRGILRIAAAAVGMEIESDPLPDDVRVWQLVRCEGCGTWLAFGPAQVLESGRYLFVNPRFRFPARPLAKRFATMAMASRDPLEGSVLSAGDIARTALGLSRVLPVENTVPVKVANALVELVSVNGENVDAEFSARVRANDGLLTAICTAGALSPSHSVFVGYRDPQTSLWYFQRATRSGEHYRVVTSVPPAAATGAGANSVLLPVIAEALPTDRGLQQEWWMEMIVAVGEPVAFILPSLPWYSRALRWMPAAASRLSSIAATDENRFTETEKGMNWTNLMNLLGLVIAIVLGILVAVWAWRHRTGGRVIVNAWLDARSRKARTNGEVQPFETVIEALTESKILKIRKNAATRIARHRGALSTFEEQLHTTYEPEYERLKEKTGRHDASVALGPTSHTVLLSVLTIGESAFNLAVFYVFREPAVYTFLMALAVAVAIPICAFSVGLWVRRWRQPWLGTTLKLVTTMLVLGLALIGLNHVRMAHLSTVAPDFVRQHPELNAAFLSFNTLIFLAAAMVTYWSHDPEENFAEAKHKIEPLRKKAAQLRSKIASLDDRQRSDVEQEREHGKYYAALYRTVFDRHAPSSVR